MQHDQPLGVVTINASVRGVQAFLVGFQKFCSNSFASVLIAAQGVSTRTTSTTYCSAFEPHSNIMNGFILS